MKVIMLNGSPRKDSNVGVAFKEIAKVFDEENIEYEIIQVGQLNIPGCKACGWCHQNGMCVVDDIVRVISNKLKEADGMIVGSPVYYASANGTLISLLDRVFFSSRFDKSMKVGASVVCCRRGGASATFDELNKYFTIAGMPIASSQYWNSIHGMEMGEANDDEEGKQTMRTLARNMSFLMKSIELGKEKYGLPNNEKKVATNFIR